MNDNDGKKTLGVGGPHSGNVKQSFSHGRTKNVVVETKRKRIVKPKPGGTPGGVGRKPVSPGSAAKRPAGISDVEMDRRMKALRAAKARETEEVAKREADEKEREASRQRRREEAEAKEREEVERAEKAKAKVDAEERKRAESEEAAKQAAVAAAAPQPEAKPQAARGTPNKPVPAQAPRKQDRERDQNRRGKGRGDDDGRRSGKLTLNQALSGREGGRQKSMAAMKRKQERARQKAMGVAAPREKVIRDVQLPETIVVSELANRMAERVGDVVKALMNSGMMMTQNQSIDADTAELIIEEFGHKVVRVSDSDVEDVIDHVEDKPEDLQDRPPV
ncbi:Translation initiation factor 2, partial [hydrothermal vent metagenome]